MGLRVSLELPQMALAAFVGHPAYVSTPVVGVRVNVWIDSIQIAGPHSAVDIALLATRRAAEKFRAPLSVNGKCLSTAYAFASLAFNHTQKTACMCCRDSS